MYRFINFMLSSFMFYINDINSGWDATYYDNVDVVLMKGNRPYHNSKWDGTITNNLPPSFDSRNKWDDLIDRGLLVTEANILIPGEPVSYVHPKAPTKRLIPEVKSILSLKANVSKGKDIAARCTMCHQIADKGVLFGPSLNGWAKSRSKQEVLNAIMYPDAAIAHGFDSSRVLLKNGQYIDGIVTSGASYTSGRYSKKAPYLIVQTAGGQTQKISWNFIKEVKKNDKSLMFYPENLGLIQAQDLADLVEYLQGI